MHWRDWARQQRLVKPADRNASDDAEGPPAWASSVIRADRDNRGANSRPYSLPLFGRLSLNDILPGVLRDQSAYLGRG
jgi:hypothetical protein